MNRLDGYLLKAEKYHREADTLLRMFSCNADKPDEEYAFTKILADYEDLWLRVVVTGARVIDRKRKEQSITEDADMA